MPFKSKRSQSMMGKTNAKKSKQVHGEPSPDEAPVLATKRCRYGWPAPVAAEGRRRRAAALGARPRAMAMRARPTSTRACAHSRPSSSLMS